MSRPDGDREFPYNLRSRKSKMVPYVQSQGPRASDGLNVFVEDFDLTGDAPGIGQGSSSKGSNLRSQSSPKSPKEYKTDIHSDTGSSSHLYAENRIMKENGTCGSTGASVDLQIDDKGGGEVTRLTPFNSNDTTFNTYQGRQVNSQAAVKGLASHNSNSNQEDIQGVVESVLESHTDKSSSSSMRETRFMAGAGGDTDIQPLLGDSDSDTESGTGVVKLEESSETSLQIILQVTFPYIIAGFGMVAAGMVLDIVQHWPVFVDVSEIFVLVPALLGLKGNLEMTLASRLSTQANLGNLNKKSEKWKMIGGNMALIQAQAIVVGFLASCVAMVMGWIPEGKFNIHHAMLLCASSMCTASVASFILGSVMVGVVLLSRWCKVNPDNVATPIAASLGDLTTLALLSGIACLLYKSIGTQPWLAPLMIVIFLLLTPLWIYISIHNHYTNNVVYFGWTPVLCAMFISSIGGLILDFTVANYNGIAVFQPVINGVGGNLVAVQASRISTSLHQTTRPGHMPINVVKGCPSCPSAFFGKNTNARACRVLLALVIPGHLIFIYTISFLKAGHTSITLIFTAMYLTAAMLQVGLLLYIANWMVHFIWRKGDDPDNVAIPYLTALGDLLGTALLAIAFHILYLIGDKDADLGD